MNLFSSFFPLWKSAGTVRTSRIERKSKYTQSSLESPGALTRRDGKCLPFRGRFTGTQFPNVLTCTFHSTSQFILDDNEIFPMVSHIAGTARQAH